LNIMWTFSLQQRQDALVAWASGRLSPYDACLACKHNFYIMPL
jgi:hypothetical protein